MKKIYFSLGFLLFTFCLYSQNLATTATITVSSTNGANTANKTVDGNGSTYWESNGSESQYIQYELNKTIRGARVVLTNYHTYSGSVMFSINGTTWIAANGPAGNFSSSSTYVTSTFNNLYSLSGGSQFNEFKFVRICLNGYMGNVSLGETSITEINNLVYSFSGSGSDGVNIPIKALDFDASTYFQSYQQSLSLNLQLGKTYKALIANIKSDTKNLKIDIDGTGGKVEGYYYTLNPEEQFLIVSPGGISNVKITYKDNSAVKLYNVAFEEIQLNDVSRPFYYDSCGNMTMRTIFFPGGLKSAENVDSTSVMPEEKQYSDDFSGKKIFVYPIPTKGFLTVDFKNFKDGDNVHIELFTVSGQKILDKNTTPGKISYDLGNRANGTYILNIKVNSETHKWTIIKE